MRVGRYSFSGGEGESLALRYLRGGESWGVTLSRRGKGEVLVLRHLGGGGESLELCILRRERVRVWHYAFSGGLV